MESCWYDLESHVRGAVLGDKIKEVSEIVRQTQASECMASRAVVLSKITSATEEGSDVPGLMMLGQRVDRNEVWDAWIME